MIKCQTVWQKNFFNLFLLSLLLFPGLRPALP